MKDEVNVVLPAKEQIPEFGPTWLRGSVIRKHREFYSTIDLGRRLYRWWAAATVTFLAALACVLRRA